MAKRKARKGNAKRAAAKALKSKRTVPERVKAKGKDEEALLASLADAQPSGGMWKPEVLGDQIVGEVLSDKTEKGKFGDQRVLILGNADGARTVYANKNLAAALDAQGVKVGDIVGVEFRGTMPVGRGRPMKLYVARRLGGAGKIATRKAKKRVDKKAKRR